MIRKGRGKRKQGKEKTIERKMEREHAIKDKDYIKRREEDNYIGNINTRSSIDNNDNKLCVENRIEKCKAPHHPYPLPLPLATCRKETN